MILSDFWPHGKVAQQHGITRYIDVHDINKRPPLDDLAKALSKLR